MNLKKFITLLFIMLLGASSIVFAANNTRNVYSVYSDNFNGAHFYGTSDTIPSSDEDGIKEYHWNNQIQVSTQSIGSVEGPQYSTYKITTTQWDVIAYTPIVDYNTVAPRDMSAYANGTINFLVRSTKASFLTATAGFQYRTGTGDVIYNKTLSELGFVADGAWHELSITLPSSNLGSVIALFVFQPNTLTVNDTIDIDNIRWVKSSGAASISVVRKKVSDNSTVSDQTAPLSFSESTFGQGWKVADQYLELDIDAELSSNNWEIRTYCNNTSTTTAGLYNETINEILPMAWKVSCSTLPYVYSDSEGENINTLEIGENWSQDKTVLYGLFDAGKVKKVGEGAKTWYPWFLMRSNGDTSIKSLILNTKGCHSFENTDGSGVTTQYFDAFSNFYERKPKLFIACDTKSAKAVVYTTSFVINLSYE